VIHNELRRSTLSKALKNFVGDSKTDGGLERFGETLTPVLDLWSLPEISYLRAEDLFTWNEGVSAVAAEGGMAAITNPVSSVQIAVLERVKVRGGLAAGAVMGLATRATIAATLTLANPPQSRDNRWAKTGAVGEPYHLVPLEMWKGSDPTLPFNTLLEETESLVSTLYVYYQLALPIIIKPGMGVWVQAQTVNVSMQVGFAGRVRKALPGELD
jgi:hypothetical protein